ncbi:MAG: hypothetical protein AAGG07_08520 [Planctomycetota bacterium]
MTATRWRATWTGRLAGGVCALTLLFPLAAMPFRGEADLEAVERVEQRTPSELSVPRVDQVIDEDAWASFAAGLRDRVPFRVDVTRLVRAADRGFLGKHRFGPVVRGDDGWLFFFESTGFRAVDVAVFERSIDALRIAASERGTRILLLSAPDKSSVYPELLGSAGPRYRAALEDREAVRAFFRDPARPELLDMWSVQDAAKAASGDQPIYELTGTHHNWIGASAMARAVVETLSPGLWDESALRERKEASFLLGLSRMAGFEGPEGRYVPIAVERDGVEVVAAFDLEGPVDVSGRIRSGPPNYKKPVRVITAGTAERIPGRTLLLHDSFVDSYLLDVLWPYFEDVTYVHYHNLKPGDLYGALDRFDTVIFETVERGLWSWGNTLAPREPSDPPLDVRLGVDERP